MPTQIINGFPPGIIFMWYAKAGPVPDGWAVCDGQNGTPDLRGRFVRGTAVFDDVGRIEGAESHTHDLRSGTGSNQLGIPIQRVDLHQFQALLPTDPVSNIPPCVTVLFIMKL